MERWWLIAGLTGVLLLAAFIFPSNTLTGRIVHDGSCGEFGCSQLCDAQIPANKTLDHGSYVDAGCGLGKGLVCCRTHWASGVCDYAVNCEKIREYSLYQSMEVYQDSNRERPAPVRAGFNVFILPILVILGIVAYFHFKRTDPTYEPKR